MRKIKHCGHKYKTTKAGWVVIDWNDENTLPPCDTNMYGLYILSRGSQESSSHLFSWPYQKHLLSGKKRQVVSDEKQQASEQHEDVPDKMVMRNLSY